LLTLRVRFAVVAALLAMTPVVTQRMSRAECGGAEREESAPYCLRSAVYGLLSGIALLPQAARNERKTIVPTWSWMLCSPDGLR